MKKRVAMARLREFVDKKNHADIAYALDVEAEAYDGRFPERDAIYLWNKYKKYRHSKCTKVILPAWYTASGEEVTMIVYKGRGMVYSFNAFSGFNNNRIFNVDMVLDLTIL